MTTPHVSVRATLDVGPDGDLILRCPYDQRALAKAVSGWRWHAALRAWCYPRDPRVLAALQERFPALDVAPAARAALGGATAPLSPPASGYPDSPTPADWARLAPPCPLPLRGLAPYRHQVAAFAYCLARPHAALLMEQRTGKTPVAIAVAGARFLRGEVRRALIVTKLSCAEEWADQAARHADFPHDLRQLAVLSSERCGRLLRDWTCSDRLQLAIINYSKVRLLADGPLRAWAPELVVLDESQEIANPQAQQSRAAWRLGRGARYRLLLTGTPIRNGPHDLFAQYRFLDPDVFGTSWAAFKARYVTTHPVFAGRIVGHRNVDELVAKAHRLAFRVRLADTYDMPAEVEQTRWCDLEPAARRLYEGVRAEGAARLGQAEREGGSVSTTNVLTQLLRLQQIAGGFVTDDDGAVRQVSAAKLTLLLDELDALLHADASRKVVVFARFRPEIEAIGARLAAAGLAHVAIHGGVPPDERQPLVRRFRDDPAVRVLVGQIQTAGVGLPMDRADTAVFYSTTFSFTDFDQARRRIAAVGRTTPRLYLHLQARDTVDQKVQAALAAKRNVADDVVDNWRAYLGAER